MKALSPIFSIARGSVAGSTFTANKFAQIVVRARTAPVQPGTVNQTKIKTSFAGATATWKNITPAQRQGWIDYADTLNYQGPLGAYKVPGRQVFISNVGWALYLADRATPGVAASVLPPTNPGFAVLQNLNIGAAPGGIGYTVVGNNPNPESVTVTLMNSRAFDPSRERYKGPFKSDIIFSDSVIAAGAIDIEVLNLTLTKRYFCAIRAITIDGPNRITAMSYLTAIAETAA